MCQNIKKTFQGRPTYSLRCRGFCLTFRKGTDSRQNIIHIVSSLACPCALPGFLLLALHILPAWSVSTHRLGNCPNERLGNHCQNARSLPPLPGYSYCAAFITFCGPNVEVHHDCSGIFRKSFFKSSLHSLRRRSPGRREQPPLPPYPSSEWLLFLPEAPL